LTTVATTGWFKDVTDKPNTGDRTMGNANDVIGLLKELNTVQLEEVLRKTLKAIVQLNYRELMQENEELKERIEELESDHEQMLETFSEVEDYQRAVENWIDDAPAQVDISDYV
jgi:predicted nuclease with TOPRIM domain